MRNNVTAIEMQMGENHLENLESHQVNLAPFFFFLEHIYVTLTHNYLFSTWKIKHRLFNQSFLKILSPQPSTAKNRMVFIGVPGLRTSWIQGAREVSWSGWTHVLGL